MTDESKTTVDVVETKLAVDKTCDEVMEIDIDNFLEQTEEAIAISTSATKALDPENLPVILNGEFFKIQVLSPNGVVRAKCVICKENKCFSASLTATTNLLRHLKACHSSVLPRYDELKRNRSKISGPKLKKTKVVSISKFVKTEKLLSGLERSTCRLFVNTMIPLSIVENENFIRLLEDAQRYNGNIRENLPKRRTLTRRILSGSVEFKNVIRCRLQKAAFVCVTVDIWSCKSNTRSFLGMTAHWIDTTSFKRESCALAVKRFIGEHTYLTIYEKIKDIFADFKITSDKITCAVTDNASNFCKSFSMFGKPLDQPDFIHNVQEPNEDDDDEWDDEHEDVMNFVSFEALKTESKISTATDRMVLPPHHRCTSHTLSLLCTSDLKSFSNKTLESAFRKCQIIWNKLARSTKFSEHVQQICKRILKRPVITRWNSLYDSVVDLLLAKDQLDEISTNVSIKKFRQVEINALTEYTQCVAPVAAALDKLQAENYCYFGALIPTLITTHSTLCSISVDNMDHCADLPRVLIAGFEARFKEFLELNMTKADAIFASISHPYFKLRWISDAEKQVAFQEKFILQTIKLCGKETSDGPLVSSQGATNQSPNDDFFLFCELPTVNRTSNLEADIRKECMDYLSDGSVDLEMLHKYRSVQKMFLKYNTALPSSAPVERLFNFAGMVLSSKRRRMSDQLFEMLTLMKVNKFE